MLDKKPDSFESLIDGITPQIYDKLKTAVELGKWETGEALSEQQKEYCMQAIIAYEHRHVPLAERTGFISPADPTTGSCKKQPQ